MKKDVLPDDIEDLVMDMLFSNPINLSHVYPRKVYFGATNTVLESIAYDAMAEANDWAENEHSSMKSFYHTVYPDWKEREEREANDNTSDSAQMIRAAEMLRKRLEERLGTEWYKDRD